jgi:hypothetical protein
MQSWRFSNVGLYSEATSCQERLFPSQWRLEFGGSVGFKKLGYVLCIGGNYAMDQRATLNSIKERQRQWALSRGIAVASNGRVKGLEDNLYAALHFETQKEISESDGGELGTPGDVGKLYSLWSSSALACNVFDYWRKRNLSPLLKALSVRETGYEQPGFERKFCTGVRSARANLDIVFHSSGTAGLPIAVESKFTEPYQSNEKECLRPSYFLKPQIWEALPLCRITAESLGTAKRFKFLDAGQLVKHILGLTRTFGQGRFLLLYLWYEVEGSDASDQHRAEVAEFSRLISTEVQFRCETYQRFFSRLAPSVVGTPYGAYLRSRYFEVG